jgi:hypothetical protein
MSLNLLSSSASVLTNLMKGTKSGFDNQIDYTNVSDMSFGQFIVFSVVLVIMILIIVWVGSYIFNHSVVNVIPCVKPVSILDFFGLYIITHMLF